MPNGNGGGNGGGGFDFGSLLDALLGQLAAIIQAIINFLIALVQAIVQALNFLFGGLQDTFGFSFQSLSEVWKGIEKMMDKLWRAVILAALKKLYSLYKTLAEWAKKLKAWLDKLHALMKKYQMMYFRKVIQLIQRARKILVIFRFFHLKFAQRLDNWLAKIEGKITHYLLLVASKTNEIISWVNLIVDPRGALKNFPFVAGFIAALNVTWSGIFGTPFTWWIGLGPSTKPTTHVSVSIGKTGDDVKNGTGDAGNIAQIWPTWQTRVGNEMGGP